MKNSNEYSKSIEANILGILLQDNSKMENCYLEEKHFLDELHRRMYKAMRNLYNDKKVFTTLDLASYKNLAQHMDYIIQLVADYIGSANFEHFMSLQMEEYKRYMFYKTNKMIQDNEISFQEAIQGLKEIDSVSLDKKQNDNLSPQEIYDLATRKEDILVFTKFTNFQKYTRFMKNTLNLIAARTSIGKSAFALNLMFASTSNYKCVYLNMEMTEKLIYSRLLAIDSAVSLNSFGNVDKDQQIQSKLMQSSNRVGSKHFKMYNGTKSINSIRNIIQRETQEEHCLIFLDYIGYVKTGKKNQTETEKINEVIRELQGMTKDFNCTLFVLVQISRKGTDKPQLEHLKDSGELEQAADVVVFLHDPQQDRTNKNPVYDIILAKNRAGGLGITQMGFRKDIQTFYEISK